MLPSNIEQFISDLLSMGSLQLYHMRKKHLIMKENTLKKNERKKSAFQKSGNRIFREKKIDWYERIDCVLRLLQDCEFHPLDILLVPQNQLMCPHCLFSIRPSSPRSPVSKHHHHDRTAAAFRTPSLTCFSFVCICNPSVTCPFISSILTSHINPLTSLLPLAIFSAPATDLIPGQLLAKPLSLLSSRDSCVTTESFTSTMQSWSGERKMKSKLLCLAYKLLFQPGPSLLSFLSHLCTHIFCFLRAPHWLPKAPGFPFLQDSTSMPLSYRKPSLTLPSLCQACLGPLPLWSHSTWPFPLTMLSWNGLFIALYSHGRC